MSNDLLQTSSISQESKSVDEAKITLGLLNAIEANSAVTQRTVAQELGIALGMTNAYLKRCVRKGLVKVQQVPSNRYAYYLTPQGFAEKSRLTANYLSYSFNFFRSARSQCNEVISECNNRGWRRVTLAGIGDLGEIALLCASDSRVTPVRFFDRNTDQPRFAGLPVFPHLKNMPEFNAVIITDVINPQETFDFLIETVHRDHVLAPRLLSISRQPPQLMV